LDEGSYLEGKLIVADKAAAVADGNSLSKDEFTEEKFHEDMKKSIRKVFRSTVFALNGSCIMLVSSAPLVLRLIRWKFRRRRGGSKATLQKLTLILTSLFFFPFERCIRADNDAAVLRYSK